MKSIIQEATSIPGAITKAWHAAGKPEEFTIKILNPGQRWLFGLMSKDPVVVSIFYTEVSQKQATRKKKFTTKQIGGTPPQSKDNKDRRPSKQYDVSGKERPKEKVPAPATTHATPFSSWTPELTQDIKDWLDTALKTLSIDTPYDVSTKQCDLNITFKKPLFDEQEERMLFSSFAYLFLQSLKKKYKNKFRNFRIIFTSIKPS